MFHVLGNCIFSIYAIWRGFNGGVVMETLEQLKEIVKNAPDGATLYDGEYFKFENDEYCRWSSICDIQDWYTDLEPSCEVRSLSDIKLIIEMMEAVKSLPDKLETDKWLKGLDRPTEFAISQAKSFAIGSVFDSIRKAKELL